MGTAGRPRQFDPDTALDAAVEVFWRQGYQGAALTDLTAAMGMNRPSLYAAFGDKAHLFQKALRRYIDCNMSYVADALAQRTAREVAEAFLTGNARAVTMPGRPAGCLSVQAAVTGEDAFAELGRNRAEIQQTLTDRFRRAITEGDLPGEEDPEELAGYLITVATGFSIRAGDGATRETLLTIARRALCSFPQPIPATTVPH
jgi:AcrR family transcriptional regulator